MESLSLNSFCFKLFNNLSVGQDENFFISPFTISTALTMVYAGARAETASQLRELLSLNREFNQDQIFKISDDYFKILSEVRSDVTLNMANKIYVGKDFELLDRFRQILATSFKSSADELDFSQATEAADTINSYVEQQTMNMIKNLIGPNDLNALTKLVLISAIYFKGNWKHQFEKCHTHNDAFYLKDGSTQDVEFMSLTSKKFQLQVNPQGLKAKVCQFLYEGDKIAMTVILPNEDVQIDEIEKQLNADLLKNLLEEQVDETKVVVYLPKFKLEYKTELAAALSGLGAPDAFSSKADFSGISKEGLFISKVIHQAVVEVNEEGTEAAAATAVLMVKRCAVMEFPEEFRCNRPFIFIIHDKIKNGILFMGKYIKPQ